MRSADHLACHLAKYTEAPTCAPTDVHNYFWGLCVAAALRCMLVRSSGWCTCTRAGKGYARGERQEGRGRFSSATRYAVTDNTHQRRSRADSRV